MRSSFRRSSGGGLLGRYFSSTGYPTVGLSRDGKPHTQHVHRIVAAAFLGPAPSGYQVDHINGDKADARLVNLEYVTQQENLRRARAASPKVRAPLRLKPTCRSGGCMPVAELVAPPSSSPRRRSWLVAELAKRAIAALTPGVQP